MVELADGHTQLYLYSFDQPDPLAADAKLERQLTQGDFEVLGLAGLDEESGTIYFSCNQNDPLQNQLYAVKVDGSDMHRVSQPDGVHGALFAKDGKHYVDNFSATELRRSFRLCGDGECQHGLGVAQCAGLRSDRPEISGFQGR